MGSALATQGLTESYARWRSSQLGQITDRLEQTLLFELLGSVADKTLLDVGCGDCEIALELARRGAIVTGLDADPAMISAARRRIESELTQMDLVEGQAEKLPFNDRAFDLVLAVTVLCFVGDTEQVLKEMARVLKPGGRLVIGELGRWSLWAAYRRIRGWLGNRTWRAATFRTAANLLSLTNAAGLTVVETRGVCTILHAGRWQSSSLPLIYGLASSTWIRFHRHLSNEVHRKGGPKGSRNKPVNDQKTPPILSHKHYKAPSAFMPESLLREARRQKGLPPATVPDICILDPDGDIVRHLLATGRADRHPGWACYHTDLYVFRHEHHAYGIVGCAVGAAFAVLIAEELFASGCQFLISVTSSGQILPIQVPPYFIVIDRALRDEGTSYHYLAPSDYSAVDAHLAELARTALTAAGVAVQVGATWTTDAPFRETQEAIDAAAKAGILAVEMEAAGLYAFAQARGRSVLCIAHVTNQMGRIEGDFEKGLADGAEESLRVISLTAERWCAQDR